MRELSDMHLLQLRMRHLALAAILVLAGAMMAKGLYQVSVGLAKPAYTDERRAEQLRLQQPPFGPELKAFTRQWHADIEALRTDKWQVYDRGRALIVLSTCMIWTVFALRFWREHAFANLMTPSRSALILLGIATYLSFVPATWLALTDELDRDYLPWWADSIGLPGLSLALVASLALPFLLILLWLCVRRASLPAPLWCIDASRPLASAVATLIFGGVTVVLLALLGIEVAQGSVYAIPSFICSIYVALCLRAALLAQRAASAQTDGLGHA